MTRLDPELLRGRRIRTLLELTWGDELFHLCDSPEEPTLDGDLFLDRLTVNAAITDSIDLFSKTPTSRSAVLQLDLAGLVDVPRRALRGLPLNTATGKLWRWVEGTTSRFLLFEGDVDQPSYGDPASPDVVELTLSQRPWRDEALWPPMLSKVDTTTWPNADPNVLGEWYPDVFGMPGDALDQLGTPGLLVENGPSNHYLLIAGHHVLATTVLVRNNTDQSSNTYNVINGTDGRGEAVAYVDLDNGHVSGIPVGVLEGDRYWVSWGGTLGGRVGFDNATALRGAGDVLRWFLQRSQVPWDRGRTLPTLARLNEFELDFYAMADPQQRFSPWDWVNGNLLDILPIGIRVGPDGLFPVIWHPDVPADDCVAELEDGRNCERISGITEPNANEVRNEFRFGYALRADKDNARKTVVISGSEVTLRADTDARPDYFCKVSDEVYGTLVDEFDTRVVQSEATARRVVARRARLQSWPTVPVTYALPLEYAWLEPGDAVRLVDAGLGLSRSVQVDQVSPSADMVELVLRVNDPAGSLQAG